jgi:hypothetical protein
MATVLQPGTTGGDVVSRALALDLDEDRNIFRGLAIPRLERLQELKTVGFRVDGDLDGSTVGGRSLESVLTGVVATGRELVAVGSIELELLTVSADEGVSQRVE